MLAALLAVALLSPLASALAPAPLVRPVAARGAPATSAGAPAITASRTYVVQRVNARPLPFADRFSTTGGYEHRVWVERFLVRLDPGGSFTMTVHGAYRDVPRATPAAANNGAGQVRDEVVRGRWTLQGGALTLTPAPSRRGRQYAPATGTLRGASMVLRYRIGWAYGGRVGARDYQLTLAHDPSYL